MSASEPSDQEVDRALVERAREGDAAAFEVLVKKYVPRLYGMVFNMTASHEDTDDLMQDIFLRVHRSLVRFRGDSGFYTWVYSIAVNMTLNFLKRRNRLKTLSLDGPDGTVPQAALDGLTDATDPVREAGLHELQVRLNEALQRLSEDHRAVVTMFDIQGIPHAEISRILGVSEGTVRSRLHYAHKQLQAWLSDCLH